MQYMDLNEKRQHGTSDFPFAFYHLDRNHPRFQMNYHWHPEYEIIRVLNGTLDMTLDERRQKVCAGEMVFVHAGVLHSGVPDNDCVYECLVFDLNVFTRHNAGCAPYFQKILDRQVIVADFFPAAHASDAEARPASSVSAAHASDTKNVPASAGAVGQEHASADRKCGPLNTASEVKMRPLQGSENICKGSTAIHMIADGAFRAIREKKEGYQLELFGSLYLFFSVIFREHLYTEHEIQTRHGYRKVMQLRRVLDYIDENYSQDITLEQLAGAASMSPKYFCRFFKQMTHRTPMDYLNYQRIEHACYALSTGDAAVTDVAYACGFNDLSYFIKTFRKYKGVTPGQYRR